MERYILYHLMGGFLMYAVAYPFGDTYVSCGELQFAIRLSTDRNVYCPSPEHVRTENANGRLRLTADRLSAAGGQLSAEGALELMLERDMTDGSIIISGHGRHGTELCKSILILVKGIHVRYLDAESDNMGRWEFRHPAGIQPLVYPGREATMPLAFIGGADSAKGTTREWYALSRDERVRKKGFAAYYDAAEQAQVIMLAFEEDRRHWTNEITLPAWQFGEAASRHEIVAERCRDLERLYGMKPFHDRQELRWIDDIKVMVNFHGEHWTGHVFNTFSDMEQQIRDLCSLMPGKHMIAFLPAWDGRYYYTYPFHRVSGRMGGETGLKRFVETAHSLGVKVIPMLGGPNLGTTRFLQEHDLLDAALKDDQGMPQLQNWIDWNGDLSKENMGYLLNYGHPGLQAYMRRKVDELIDAFGFDGIFLDGAVRWSNAPDYSPYEGITDFAEHFLKRHPGKLLMGEDGYDALWGHFGMFAASCGPIGLENAMLRYTRQTEYLAYPALNGSSGIHEAGWDWESLNKSKKSYTIPALTLFAGDTARYKEEIQLKLKEYQSWRLKID
ncbi:hypothetical protein [Cohnella sp. AR92]|uniref:hypothetical protein n=1 Tax=Cohnella sp. AR92 TaxID=648716 RepID=UPI000F8E5922|nr:hypothetical protein [Cohnella sp. AR92]RUS47006.1 hypothetical protein ELR57_11420 [Cohnella sp. AR92]